MLNLVLETKDRSLMSQIEAAYDKALETCSFESFVVCLTTNTSMEVGVGGSHIWMSDKETGKRYAMIIL